MSDTESISLEELRSRLAARGFSPGEASLREIQDAWPYFQAMRARLRRGYGYHDQPAHVFQAGANAHE
ncbi:hypothetical protein [Rhodoligotrophos defluvii]|uniref:hypothetical protein n=1 Tax=Rhodoligotrophos defluvii TaxID=2561934 RepID=UPI001484EF20|nr:hypothetical protein [Rhodoligotrophos defluvii]